MKEQARRLTTNEHLLLVHLLEVEFEGNRQLLTQLEGCKARVLDANGSLGLEVQESAEAAKVSSRVPVEAEGEDRDGETIHLLLHVVGGFLRELDIYKEDETPIVQLPTLESLRFVALPPPPPFLDPGLT